MRIGCWLALTPLLIGADQSKIGEGNGAAMEIAAKAARVQIAYHHLKSEAGRIQDAQLRKETLEILTRAGVCVASKAILTPQKKAAVLERLKAEKLVPEPLGNLFENGVFPPLRDDGSDCPKLPQSYAAAPGSGFGGHHSHPGGLAIHASVNLTNALNLARNYRDAYGPNVFVSQDLMLAAPVWHDWAKTMVLQWNADGTEFTEFMFGGNGKTDAWGEEGDSRTGAHHILGLAEIVKRGLPPEFLVTVASAHAPPASGNEYKVVNWIRAACLVAGVDAVGAGYLGKDEHGRLRIPSVRKWKEPGNILAEYMLHHLSDADFVWTNPAALKIDATLRLLAGRFGFNPSDTATYNNQFRNPVLANTNAERLLILEGNQGIDAVMKEIQRIKGFGR